MGRTLEKDIALQFYLTKNKKEKINSFWKK